MDIEQLRRLWHANKDRPAFVREHADALGDHLTVSESVPEDGSMYQLRDWLERYRPTVTRQLDEAAADAYASDDDADG